MINRRQFFLTAAAATRTPAAARKVIVAGAGLAGLCCARELRKRGFDVVVLEGQGRPGGRVQTLRQGLAPALTAEAGATRIPDTHNLTLSYVRDLGLTLEPFNAGGLADVVHLRQKNFVLTKRPESDWPMQLSPEERRLGLEGLAKRYLSDPLEAASGSENSTTVPRAILARDRLTIGEYLRQQGLSPGAIELITVGVDLNMSLALLLLVEFNEQVHRQFFHIRGGNDRLPGALAAELSEIIRYGCRITAIGQDDRSSWAAIEHPGGHEILRADYLVSTLPFSVARKLFDGARLSPEKQRVIREQKYFPVVKTFLQMRTQFWRAQGQSGFANTDLLNERFWALGPPSPDQRGLLLSYLIGPNAARLDRLDPTTRPQRTLADAEQVFPGAQKNFEAAVSKSWAQDPWQLGGLPAYGPGELSFIPINARREGRILFAGEHTSRWTGWMQGAIDSAHRAVNEISELLSS